MNPYYSPYNMPMTDDTHPTQDQSLYINTEDINMNGSLTTHGLDHPNKPYNISRVIPSSIKAKKTKPERVGLRKAPGAPKRFKSSYILFFMAKQKEIKKELGERASVGEISKRSSEKWKSLSKEERAIWDAKAEEDKERYNLEKEKYTGPWQVPWKRAKKNPDAPKRPMSAFLFFSQTKRRSIKDANPGMRNTEISRVLGDMWKKASDEEKGPHIEREAVEREKYKIAIAKWKEDEAVRRKEEADEQKAKVLERALTEDKGPSFHKTAQHRNSPIPIQGTSPLPIHQSRPNSPGPVPNYYPHGSYGYPVPNYGGPPPLHPHPHPPPPPSTHHTGYNPYGSYPSQHSPQSQPYYHNYASMPPPEYQQRHYPEYPPPIQTTGSLDDHPPRHFDKQIPAQYGSYYQSSPPNGSFNAVESIRPSGSSAETEYSTTNDYPPQS